MPPSVRCSVRGPGRVDCIRPLRASSPIRSGAGAGPRDRGSGLSRTRTGGRALHGGRHRRLPREGGEGRFGACRIGEDVGDRLHDALVSGTAAEIAGKLAADPRLVGVRQTPRDVPGADQHSGRAVSALEGVPAGEGLAERVHERIVGESLDGAHVRPVAGRGERDARSRRGPVDEHCARAADPVFAAKVGPREVQALAQEIGEVGARLDLGLDQPAVYREAGLATGAHPAGVRPGPEPSPRSRTAAPDISARKGPVPGSAGTRAGGRGGRAPAGDFGLATVASRAGERGGVEPPAGAGREPGRKEALGTGDGRGKRVLAVHDDGCPLDRADHRASLTPLRVLEHDGQGQRELSPLRRQLAVSEAGGGRRSRYPDGGEDLPFGEGGGERSADEGLERLGARAAGPSIQTSAPTAASTASQSAAGSAWARLPPMVPRLRIARYAMFRAARRSHPGLGSGTSPSSISPWVMAAPRPPRPMTPCPGVAPRTRECR